MVKNSRQKTIGRHQLIESFSKEEEDEKKIIRGGESIYLSYNNVNDLTLLR